MSFGHGRTLFEEHTHPAGSLPDHSHRGLSTPSAAFPPSPREGDLFYETDTDILWVYNGAAWIMLAGNTPACRVYHDTTQVISDSIETTVAFNSERFDTDTMHDTATNNSRITFNTAGLYVVTFNGALAAAADYILVYANLRLNAGFVIGQGQMIQTAVSAMPAVTVTALWKFAAGHYVEARIYFDRTSNDPANLMSIGNWTPEFSAIWVGPG